MIKVVYILPGIKVGGSETLFDSLAEGVHDEFYLYKFCLELNSNNPIVFIRNAYKFLIFIKKNRIDYVVSSLWKAHLVVLFSRQFHKIKCIPFIHSSTFFSKMDKYFSRTILKTSNYCLVDSIRTQDFVISQFPGIVVTRVSSFLRFKNVHFESRVFRSLSDRYRFVFLGRISEVKRIDKSIRFLNKLRNLLPVNIPVVFDLYGPIEISNKRIRDWKLLSNFEINFKDSINRDKISMTLTQYNFYIQMSDFEGMAMSVIESMSLGLIPVVTNVGEIGNYCTNLKNSFLFEKEDDIDTSCENFYNYTRESHFLDRLSINAIATVMDYEDFRQDFSKKIKSIIFN
jgi:glycosyltransferase involved in cell wall biosynthesis